MYQQQNGIEKKRRKKHSGSKPTSSLVEDFCDLDSVTGENCDHMYEA